MKNNDILQALGLNIPNNQYNNPYGLNIGMDEEEDNLGVNEDDENPYNENPELDQEIPEYEEPGGEPTYSINDLLKQKPPKTQSSPQEYSFEGGMEKALSKIKGIQNQLKGDSKEINTALNDEQRGIALRRGMGAAYQADAAKPWRSTGARGFINDLSGMMMQGLGGYDTSRQQMLKENLEREKLRKALETQEAAIARAIEKDLYSRDYDQQKLGLEREKIIADKNFKVQQQEALNDYRRQKLEENKNKVLEKQEKDNPTIEIDGKKYIKLTKESRQKVLVHQSESNELLDQINTIEKNYSAYEEDLKDAPYYNETKPMGSILMGIQKRLPKKLLSKKVQEALAKSSVIKQDETEVNSMIERVRNHGGGVLPYATMKFFEQKDGYPNFDKDSPIVYKEKLKRMKEKAAEAAKKYGDVIQKGYFDFSTTKKEFKKDVEENKTTPEQNKDPFVVEKWSDEQ